MKIHGLLFVSVVLLTLFFLLAACTSAATSTSPGTSSAVTRTPVRTQNTAIPSATPGRGIKLPSQPSLAPTALPTTQPRTSPVATPTSGSTASGGVSGTPNPVSQAAQSVFMIINQERVDAGKPALVMSNALIQSAHKHNLAMLAAGQLSHQLPGEADLGIRITAQGVRWTMVAENIGYGFGDATQTAVSLNRAMFAEKPPDDGHRQNILSSNTIVGIDVIVNTQNSQVWLTEDFARE